MILVSTLFLFVIQGSIGFPENYSNHQSCNFTEQNWCIFSGKEYPRGKVEEFQKNNLDLVDSHHKNITFSRANVTWNWINACAVEEQIVSPFWAINGEGKQVMLFHTKTYHPRIHIIKCAESDAQDQCRNDCKCKQDYLYQQLLVYDPSGKHGNIYSDWFSFESSCICGCQYS